MASQEASETKVESSTEAVREVPDVEEIQQEANYDSNYSRQPFKKNNRQPANNRNPPQGRQGNFNDNYGQKRRFKSTFKDENQYESHFIQDKLFEISGPTVELPSMDMKEKKFNGRNRLYIGNIVEDITEEELTELFQPHGELHDIFINKDKNFAFIIMDYHSNAEKAKRELDGYMFKGNPLKIRFSPKASTVKVTNLLPSVTNELLYHGFQIFGEIERAIVSVDERGRSTCTGFVDFVRKKSALAAIRECSEGCFFLTGSLKPCIVESYEPVEEIDGFGEKSVQWRSGKFLKDRETGPWFAKPNSFEFELATKWKQIVEIYKQKEEALKKDLLIEEEKLEAQIGFARYEYETQLLKKELESRQLYWEQQKMELEQKERKAEQQRLRNEEDLRRREEQIQSRMVARREEELRHHSEDNGRNYRSESNRYYDQGGDWEERYSKEGYWQRDQAPLKGEEEVTKTSQRQFNTFGEEALKAASQIWESPEDQNGDMFVRRADPVIVLEEERPRSVQDVDDLKRKEFSGPSRGNWNRNWDKDFPAKRGRF